MIYWHGYDCKNSLTKHLFFPKGDRGLPGPAGPAGPPGIGLIGSKVMPGLYEGKTKAKLFCTCLHPQKIHSNVFAGFSWENRCTWSTRVTWRGKSGTEGTGSFSPRWPEGTPYYTRQRSFMKPLLSKLSKPVFSGWAWFSRDLRAQGSSRTRSAGG